MLQHYISSGSSFSHIVFVFACYRRQWEVKNDDYGRVYYANWETGEAAYDPPLEVGYRPPLGRNELGENVDPRLQALRYDIM